MKDIFKPLLPHVIAIAAFIIILFLYFKPAFEGKRLPQNDVLQGRSASKEIRDYREKTGEEALWCNTMFSGMPAYIISTVYSGDITMKINQTLRGFFPPTADVIFVNFICMYIMLLCFGVRAELSFLGGFAYAFSTFTILSAEAGHLYKVLAIGYFPLIIGGIKLIYSQKLFKGAVITALGMGLELASQHYQITYYAGVLIAIMGLVYLGFALKSGDIKPFLIGSAVVLISVIVGIGPSAARLMTTLEYNEYSIRGKKELTPAADAPQTTEGLDRDYAFAWSQGIWETMTYIIPNLYGGASGESLDKKSNTYQALKDNNVPLQNIKGFTQNVPTYWGDQPFTGGPMYAGITIVALAILGLFTLEKREKIWITVGIVLLTCISWGRNFEALNFFLFDHFPMYNKFRTVSMSLSIVTFGLILLGILGIHNFLALDKKEQLTVLKKAAIAVLSTIGVVYIISMFMSFEGPKDIDMKLPEWLLEAIVDDRKSMFHSSMFRSLLFSIGILGVVYMYVIDKLNTLYLSIALSFVVVLDLWVIDKKYLAEDDFKKAKDAMEIPMTQANRQILQDQSYYRVFDLNNPFNNAHTSYYHNSIGGYSGVKMQRYQDLIENHLSQNNQAVLDMLNTKYIITNKPETPVYTRQTALGAAWLVGSIKPVQSADEEIVALNNFQPNNESVVDVSKFKTTKTHYSTDGTIQLDNYDPKHLTYTADVKGDALATFSEIYYPKGWNAYIDGKLTEYIRCNYVLRGLEIPTGKHTIEFKFEPTSYYKGNQISLIFSIILIVAIIGVIGLEIYSVIKANKHIS